MSLLRELLPPRLYYFTFGDGALPSALKSRDLSSHDLTSILIKSQHRITNENARKSTQDSGVRRPLSFLY